VLIFAARNKHYTLEPVKTELAANVDIRPTRKYCSFINNLRNLPPLCMDIVEEQFKYIARYDGPLLKIQWMQILKESLKTSYELVPDSCRT
jgi:hypothetical protein